MIAALARTALRLRYYKRLFVDDGFLILALILTSASVGVYVHLLDGMYISESVSQGKIPLDVSLLSIEKAALRFHVLSDVFVVLTWTSIIAVKFSVLFFFKTLIFRIRYMEMLWRYVTVATLLSWIGWCISSILGCPYFDLRSGKADLAVACILADEVGS